MTYRTHKKVARHSLTARNLGLRAASQETIPSSSATIVSSTTGKIIECGPNQRLVCKRLKDGSYSCKCVSGSPDLIDPFRKKNERSSNVGNVFVMDGASKSNLRCPPGKVLVCRHLGGGKYDCKCTNPHGSHELKDPFESEPEEESRAEPRLAFKTASRSSARKRRRRKKRRGFLFR